eukprot:360988-Chlamydomonas_euryale.AAC.5
MIHTRYPLGVQEAHPACSHRNKTVNQVEDIPWKECRRFRAAFQRRILSVSGSHQSAETAAVVRVLHCSVILALCREVQRVCNQPPQSWGCGVWCTRTTQVYQQYRCTRSTGVPAAQVHVSDSDLSSSASLVCMPG